MALGTFMAICNGASMPLFALLWGNMLDSFAGYDDMVNQTFHMLLLFIYVGLGVFASGWVMVAAWLITGERQSI
jgi:ATP-binding cassette subfamily B (MDR/TAP) protein 1